MKRLSVKVQTPTNVIPLQRAQRSQTSINPASSASPITIPLARFLGPQAVSILSTEINRWLKRLHGATRGDLARLSSLGTETVRRIHLKITREPHSTTIIKLLIGLGFSVMRIDP